MEEETRNLQPAAKPPSNLIHRLRSGTIMVVGFMVLIWLGPLMLIFLNFILQILCFQEPFDIIYKSNKIPSKLSHFKFICWYFVVTANYFFTFHTLAPHFSDVFKNNYLHFLINYNHFISFCLYFIGILIFVLSLVRKHDLKQFKILVWTHTLLLIIVVQSYMLIDNMFAGLIWVILPPFVVTLNDIFAYFCGRFWGKTPLIELSPKKTWEGFIGGAIGTFISGYFVSSLICGYQYFVCPVEYQDGGFFIQMKDNCTVSYMFTPINYPVLPFFSINFYPFTYHFLALALFASLIAPFGGFWASGFKRAYGVKDFGNVIPGHGGIMDRYDCQILMYIFVNVYISTFITNPTVDSIFEKILLMDDQGQVEFYHMLKHSLEGANLMNLTIIQ